MTFLKKLARLALNILVLSITFCLCGVSYMESGSDSTVGLVFAAFIIPIAATVGVNKLTTKLLKGK